ncbi:MAG: hypothetical protein LC105_00250 [Chitinophagales bacterium]|nr:hypothetical protein [Chitinophagales bacterium]MCZ2392275.1 hypothetical protein [Chitinophagales bacterium]
MAKFKRGIDTILTDEQLKRLHPLELKPLTGPKSMINPKRKIENLKKKKKE